MKRTTVSSRNMSQQAACQQEARKLRQHALVVIPENAPIPAVKVKTGAQK
jgi:hypothetical protein